MIICIEKLFLTAKLPRLLPELCLGLTLGVFAAQISPCCTILGRLERMFSDVTISSAGFRGCILQGTNLWSATLSCLQFLFKLAMLH